MVDITQQDDKGTKTDVVVTRLTTESWRLAEAFRQLIMRLDPSEQRRHASALKYFKRQLSTVLSDIDVALPELEGQKFDVGLPVHAINLGEFGPNDVLFVEQVIEPVILRAGQVARMGTVVLRKAE